MVAVAGKARMGVGTSCPTLPGFCVLGSSPPDRTSCPYDCVRPGGPSSGGIPSGWSFCPEKTQIEFAWAGAPVGLPFPVTSPANAEPAPIAETTTAVSAAASNDRLLICFPPPFVVGVPNDAGGHPTRGETPGQPRGRGTPPLTNRRSPRHIPAKEARAAYRSTARLGGGEMPKTYGGQCRTAPLGRLSNIARASANAHVACSAPAR